MSDNAKIGFDNGNLNALGVDIKISDIIGEKIINQWMAQLSEEDMQSIFQQINAEIFSSCDEPKKIKMYNSSGWSSSDTFIWESAKKAIAKQLGDDINAKIEAIISSEEFQKKSEEIAQELVDYATEGYKQDLKVRIRQRLVDNVIANEPSYYNYSLRDIIHQELDSFISNGQRY